MKYENVWYWDGSWRDIYVLDVNISHWQRVMDWLHTNPYPIEFHLGNEQAVLPREVSAIFQQTKELGVLMKIAVESVTIHCHFFWDREIEFDIDPREVNSEQDEQGIRDFMTALGKLLNKEVILTPESGRGTALLAYIPEQDEFIHNSVSLEPLEIIELSREEGLRLMARAYGVDENDEAAIIKKMLDAVNKPAYEGD